MAVENADVFVGITNENEFYGHHYLAEVFKGDIRERLNAWSAFEDAAKAPGDDWRAPQHVLAGCGGRWFRQREKLRSFQEPEAFHAAFAELQRPLLAALGYANAPGVHTLACHLGRVALQGRLRRR
jgi:hypothetical protein